MVDIIHSFFEEDFSTHHTTNLSILLGIDRLSYLVSSVDDQVLALRTYRFTDNSQKIDRILRHLFTEELSLRKKFKKIYIGLWNADMTLVPQQFYQKSSQRNYLEALMPTKDLEEVFCDFIPKLDAHNVYKCDQKIIKAFQIHYPDAQICHATSGLIEHYSKLTTAKARQVFVNLYSNQMGICVFDKHKLLLNNTFSVQSSNDCLYYILLAYKSLALRPKSDPIFLSGGFLQASQLYDTVYKYIQEVAFLERPDYYTFSEKLKEKTPSHFYIDLFGLKLCAS
ncbi:MAG: DUF3822 family protein [Saprospiraceae bacterium]|nr:DUF3822 family protein [Saprospiraceae bacterium]